MDTIMSVLKPAASRKSRVGMALSLACLVSSCHKKDDAPLPAPPPRVQEDSGSGNPPDPALAQADSVAAIPAPSEAGGLEFTSRPPAKAYAGTPYLYRPTLSRPGAFKLRVVKGPDSAMKADKGRLTWTPTRAGRYPVLLEASLPASPDGETPVKAQQGFMLSVEAVLSLVMKPLPPQADKGDTVTFDFRGSSFPSWAASSVTVRLDYEGDGKWDTEALPLAGNLVHRHAYGSVGRFAPKAEARYRDSEIRSAEGAIAIVSPVMPVLKIGPDTVEPGGAVTVDASGSKADGRLVYSLDLDGDGKPEWVDSASGKAVLKAPASGTYQTVLLARNPMGQEGRASAVLRVNARPRLEFKVRNPKENMAASVELKARATDADDSLAKVRFNFTGAPEDWAVRETPPDSQAGPREWWLRFKHAYGKVGKYTATVCATSQDGREACRSAAIEIFNAPPVCRPGPDLRATLGKPLEIDGEGVDPDGKIVKWEWDLDGDGKYDLVSSENGRFHYTFSKEGVFPLVLRVTTADGMAATGTRKVEVRKKWKA